MLRKKTAQHLRSLLVCFLLLVPMMVMIVHATSSQKTTFSFSHNSAAGTIRDSATKVDINSSGENYMNASMYVTAGYFSTASASVWVERTTGQDLTPAKSVSALGSYTLSYYGDAFSSTETSCSVYLVSSVSTSGISGYGGYWYP